MFIAMEFKELDLYIFTLKKVKETAFSNKMESQFETAVQANRTAISNCNYSKNLISHEIVFFKVKKKSVLISIKKIL